MTDGNAMLGLVLQHQQQRRAQAVRVLLDDSGDDDLLVAAAAAGARDYAPGQRAPKQTPTHHADRRAVQDEQRARKAALLMQRPCELLLVRHGQTAWNVQGRLQGQQQPGPPLDELGLQQAAVAAHVLAQRYPRVDAVFSSDLLRAVQTAEDVAAPYGLQVQQRVALRERNLGVLQGLTYADGPQAQPDAWAALQSSNSSVRVPGGESLDDLRARLTAAVLDIAAAHPGQRVIVVSHGGALHALHAVARGYQARGKVANCSLTVLLAEADETVLQQQHQHQHQQPASVPGASSSSMQVAAEGHGDTQAAADDDPASPCQDSCAGAEGSSSSRAARHPSSQRCGSGCVQGGRLALLSWNEVDAQLQSETGFGGSSRAG